MSNRNLSPLTSSRAQRLAGRVRAPGDKSISHRALILGAVAEGRTRVTGLLEGEDVLNTLRSLAAMGATFAKTGRGSWEVTGCGAAGLRAPTEPLDFGNSGTGARLMLGVIAGRDLAATLVGDASLSRRPMGRVLAPLKQMGLTVLGDDTNRDRLPLTVRGVPRPKAIAYPLPVPSAQVKSAVLLAGLTGDGRTTVIESEPTRDHTERMLRFFGAEVETVAREGATHVSVAGGSALRGGDLIVPGDPSSAAFVAAAAAIVPDSEVVVESVLVNPRRIGFYVTLNEMGGDVAFLNEREECGEPVADIRVRSARLKGVRVPAERAPSMIDEYPVLAAVAAFAEGETRMEGLAELKIKESDRAAATAAGLVANGVDARVEGDSLIVAGRNSVRGGGVVATHMDHRIAMAFLVLGLASDRPVTVDDATMIATSFPEFRPLMEGLGAKFDPVAEPAP